MRPVPESVFAGRDRSHAGRDRFPRAGWTPSSEQTKTAWNSRWVWPHQNGINHPYDGIWRVWACTGRAYAGHDDIGLEIDFYVCLPLCSFAHACEGHSPQAGTPEIAIPTHAGPCGIRYRNGMP
uniref:Uncharacterized protein n=1 Tax=Ananas comosus var. bracteatus TaxID=296719 RepID=A0A6V7PGM8_ANACO|nr:unnamed protein product [Ananas comosus var. bracteatus]